jgi:hypothetical protein
MYMRYAGGGVGHYRVTLTDTPADADETQEDFTVDNDVTVDPIQDDSVEDQFSDLNSESEEDGEENPDEDDDLGAEDGEGGFLDPEDEEGYAAL